MAASNGNGGSSRKETATWAIGAAAAGVITSFAAAVQVIQEPLQRDISSLQRQIVENAAIANDSRNELRDELRRAIDDALGRTDERMRAMAATQAQINTSYGSGLGELAARIARIEDDRSKVVHEAIGRLQRIEDHINALDGRVQRAEDNMDHVMRGDAVKPDRLGGPPYGR